MINVKKGKGIVNDLNHLARIFQRIMKILDQEHERPA